MKRLLSLFLISIVFTTATWAIAPRSYIDLNTGWKFALGNAADMQRDFTHGTEYFTYLSKVQATFQATSPILDKFDDSQWVEVDLPHDWVVDLPYSGEASHSHGYKMVGWKYPENSVGWYRKHFAIDKAAEGQHIYVVFDAIFRDAQVFCNGFYLGHEPSGYASQVYDLTEYLNYGGDNLLTVRADASTEEGWYYEGAGIYGNVRLYVTSPLRIEHFGTQVTTDIAPDYGSATMNVATTVKNDYLEARTATVKQQLLDASGTIVAQSSGTTCHIAAKGETKVVESFTVTSPHLWQLDAPYLYTVITDIYDNNGSKIDSYSTRTGIRSIEFNAQRGFLLNGEVVKIKGTNMHLDHAGVGVAVGRELWRYRIERLKWMGSNAIRSSHNPASPEMLDLCDEMGMLVIDENRLMGINDEHIDLLQRMIKRDCNHPSIILWSIGNEEWAIEGTESGKKIARAMCAYVHQFDSTRLATAGNAGGTVLIHGLDVQGYNYIIQNDVDGLKARNPQWCAVGTEETSGCGTRDVYYTDSVRGWMASINRTPAGQQNMKNVIERGWKFYDERPWLGGLFYWTGLDYRGEPNPMKWPATGSQFGLMDYCGYPKDEAYYLKAWWADEPVLHILPHWNLTGHEGETIEVWAYSNCDEVELTVNGRKLGRKAMPRNGHIEWTATYEPGKLEATGYRNGKKVLKTVVETTGTAEAIEATAWNSTYKGDGSDLTIIDLTLTDNKGRRVPDANIDVDVAVTGDASILGYGNGDPGFKSAERPAPGTDRQHFTVKTFAGRAQLLITPHRASSGKYTVTLSSPGMNTKTLTF